MAKKHLLLIFLLIGVAVSITLLRGEQTSTEMPTETNTQDKTKNQSQLTITPQTPADNVNVDRATLTQNGFLVVRQMEGDKLSQVVEMSKPLSAGTHENIAIPLGNVDVGGTELIVMIYEDYDNDNVFNDLDMPALNDEGMMTAVYVRTGNPLPASIAEADSAMPAHTMPGMKDMVKVRYTDTGFIPENAEVESGSMVEFVNESSTQMWVASAPHPSHQILPTFDQFKPTKKGSIYRYTFDKPGEWEYHDHINPSRGGTITVQE